MDNTLIRLSSYINKKATQEGINDTPIPFVKFFKSTSKNILLHTVYEPSLFIITQGAKIVILGTKTIEYDSSSYLTSTSYLPVSGKITKADFTKPFLSIQITFDIELIFELLQQIVQEPQESIKISCALSSYQVTHGLLEILMRLIDLMESPEDIEVLAPLYHKEILYRLLKTNNHPEFRQLAYLEGNAYKVSQVISLMRADMFEPLSVCELAKSVNMSTSAFHKHFKNMIAMSPIQYRKVQRLHEAKRLMISENLDVSGAAFYVGYESVSQFSREYSKYFGLSPSRDIKILKQQFNVKDI